MIDHVPAPFEGLALICRKCSNKLDGGFGPGGDEKLAKTLRKGLKAQGRRRALRIVEVPCLGLCPKNAVTVATSAAPGNLLVIGQGTRMDEVIAALAPHLS